MYVCPHNTYIYIYYFALKIPTWHLVIFVSIFVNGETKKKKVSFLFFLFLF